MKSFKFLLKFLSSRPSERSEREPGSSRNTAHPGSRIFALALRALANSGMTMRFFVLFLPLSLTACGFHLRNQYDVPPQLNTLYVQSIKPQGNLTTQFKASLRSLNVHVTDQASQAPYTISITNENFSQTGNLMGTVQQVNLLTITYTVTFALKNSQQQIIAGPWIVSSSNSYLQNANQVLSDSAMTATLQQQLVRNTVDKMLQYLNATNTRNKLQHS